MRITAKFGGSSLADAGQFQKVKAIVEANPSRQCIVVSAPGRRYRGDEKITDLLYQCQALAASGAPFEQPFRRIANRFRRIAASLSLSVDIESELSAIYRILEDGASPDYAASRGEYLNALLMADYLGFRFVDATELVCFHDDGAYDDETTQLWSRVLETRARVVIPGFYGRRRDGAVRTFSRGGSDITGAIVARDGELFEPRVQDVPAQVQIGWRWSSRFARQRGATRVDGYYDFMIAARERLDLPFGAAEAFRIEGEGFDSTGTRRVLAIWIVPGVNYALRSDVTVHDGRSLRIRHAERREMVSCRQLRWRQA